jgi:Tol biopolymer transport system component
MTPGDRLGPYEILAQIGAGGMGEVWKARDPRVDRLVAIKVSKAEFSERFSREAKAIAQLNHPHICQLYDVGPNYLVLEYVEGSPLKGPLPVAKAVEYAGQILSALDAAHRKSITHRDLKPANILVTKQGIKLLDFGLARMTTSSADSTLTMKGDVLGTPAYMSPEQWEGKPGDARSDVYCFGCVLYEMLTGKRATQDRGPVEPVALDSIVRTCMEQDPEDRWQTARDIRRAMTLPTPAVPKPSRTWQWIAVAALVLLAAVLLLGSWFNRAPAAGEVVSFAIYPPDKTTFSAPLNITVNVPQFAVSPDGRMIVFAAVAEGERPLLWRRAFGDAAARSLAGTEDAQEPFWSPDSHWIGFFAEGKLKRVPAAGGAVEVVVADAPDVRGGTWGADDTIVYANGIGLLQRVAAAGGQRTPASTSEQTLVSHRYPHFLPDGRHFLYLSYASTVNDQNGLYIGSPDDKDRKLRAPIPNSAVYAVPGNLLFVDGDTLFGQTFDADRLQVSGPPFLIAEHAGRSSGWKSAISASRTGVIAYAGTLSPNGHLAWFDRAGRALDSAGPEGYYADVRLSPSEKSIASALFDSKMGTLDIWITDLARGRSSRITSGGASFNASPIWSPDGEQLVYRSLRVGGLNEFYQRSAAGGGGERLVLPIQVARAAGVESGNLVDTDWSPDGQSILFSAPGTASGTDLWLLPLTGDKKPVKYLATPADEMHGNFSPDGRLVAYTSNESGKYQVYVQTLPLSDKKWQVSTNGGYEPRWRADGREIYYLSEDRKLMAVPVGAGPTFDVPTALFQTRVPAGVTANRTHYVPSRDGQRFLVNTQSGEASPSPITVVMNWAAGLKK